MKYLKNVMLLTVSTMFVLLFSNCNNDKDKDTPILEGGKLKLSFAHYYDGKPCVYDKMIYKNAAGNQIEIYDVRWFLSEIVLYPETGTPFKIQKAQDIFYVDNTIPSTLNFDLLDIIPPGKYDSLTFTFGINAAKNIDYLFVNPPEANMSWPSIYGGGYHYMQIDGFWNDSSFGRRAFNFHIGIGSVITPKDTSFVQNYFTVSLKDSSFTIIKNKSKEIQIIMNIEEWFKNPNIYDFDFWGPQIMENESAMAKICQNGRFGVFKVGYIKDIQ